MPDDFEDEDPPYNRRATDREMSALRRDLQEKHLQNRRDIHAVRNEQQKVAMELAVFKEKMEPLLDNGQPGVITKMSNKMDTVLDELNEVRITQGADTGRRASDDWWRDGLKALIVGVIVALAAHFWK